MPLTLRPTTLSSPAYRDWADYIVREASRAVGRIYEDRHTLPGLRWFWSITMYVNPKLGHHHERARCRAWMRLKRNSYRTGKGAELDSLGSALYLACRHVVASACPAGGLHRAVPSHQRPAAAFW